MSGSKEKKRYQFFLETVKFKFEAPPPLLLLLSYEVFSLKCIFYCQFIVFSKHLKLMELLLIFFVPINFDFSTRRSKWTCVFFFFHLPLHMYKARLQPLNHYEHDKIQENTRGGYPNSQPPAPTL